MLEAMLQDAIGAEAVEPGNVKAKSGNIRVEPQQGTIAGDVRVELKKLQLFFTTARGSWTGLDLDAITGPA